MAGSLRNTTHDIAVIKTNAGGDTLFTFTYSTGYDEEAYCVRTCLDSGYIVCGYRYNGSNNDVIIIKLDVRVVQQWATTWNNGARETARSIVQLADSSFVLCGSAYINSSDQMLIMQISKTGSAGWYKHYRGEQQSHATGLCKSYDGGFVMAGYGITAGSDTNALAIRTDNGGDSLWAATVACAGNRQASGIAAVNGNFYLVAGTAMKSNGYTDAFAWKINDRGGKIFYKTYGCGYDDCAQAVRQMPDLSYVLGGYKSNSTSRQAWMVKIGEWGDTVQTMTYATDYDEQLNEVCVTAASAITGTGTQHTATTALLQWQYVLPYYHYYPRYMWVNNVYNVAPNVVSVLGDSTGEAHLIEYLTTLKYTGVVITHFEFIAINHTDSIPDLFIQLDSLIARMHLSGIPVVMAQFRGDEKNLTPDSSFARMNKALDSLKVYNNSASVMGRFDGLMLDYEIWNDDYGGTKPDSNRYDYINTGWNYWKRLADSVMAASNNTIYHLPLTAVWVGNICNPDTILQLDTIVKTDSIDHRLMISKIDSFQFDRVVLSFFLKDTLIIGPSIQRDPTAFLLRTSDQADWFNRLWYFGHDSLSSTAKNYPTNIIPNFHAGYGDEQHNWNPKLIYYLSGTDTWAPTKHYLCQAEQIFDGQFYDTVAFHNHDIPYGQRYWGSVNINGGFEWFKYQIGPLEYDSLNDRLGDAIHSSHYYPLPARFGYYDFEVNENNKEFDDIIAYPNPVINNFSIKLKDKCKTNNLYIKCYDLNGKEITNLFNFSYLDCVINIQRIGTFKGVMLCYIMDNNLIRGSTKFILQ